MIEEGSARPTLRSWLGWVALGEGLGFTSTALIAFGGLQLFGRPSTVAGRAIALLVMTLAGTLEGASLGYAQWRLLARWLPALSRRAFVGATIAVAASGWALGMSVPLVATALGAGAASTGTAAPASAPAGPPWFVIVAFASVFGALAGLLFGVVQARALAPHVDRTRPWVLGTAAGWALGLPFSYLAGSAGSPGGSALLAALIAASAAVAMGLCVGACTWRAMFAMRPARADNASSASRS